MTWLRHADHSSGTTESSCPENSDKIAGSGSDFAEVVKYSIVYKTDINRNTTTCRHASKKCLKYQLKHSLPTHHNQSPSIAVSRAKSNKAWTKMFQNRSKTTSSSSLVLGPCLFPWWWGEEHDEDAHARGKNVHRWGCVTIRLRHGIIQKANVTQKVLSNCQGQGDTSGEDWAEKHAWARKKPWNCFFG